MEGLSSVLFIWSQTRRRLKLKGVSGVGGGQMVAHRPEVSGCTRRRLFLLEVFMNTSWEAEARLYLVT